jgi:thiol-disulfide isomerase/thioredoxin
MRASLLRWAVVCSVALLALIPQAARAQAQPDGRALMAQADQALREVRSISFSAERMGVGNMALTTPGVVGTVRIENLKLGAPAAWDFAFRGARTSSDPDGQPVEFLTTSRGGVLTIVDHPRKKVLQGRSTEVDEALAQGPRWIASFLLHWDTLVSGPLLRDGSAEAQWMGRASAGGQVCDVVRIDMAAVEGDVRSALIYLSTVDRLPRRLDVQYLADGEFAYSVLEISDLQSNQPIDPGVYSYPLPAGYEPGPILAAGRAEPAAEPMPALLPAGKLAPDFTLPDAEGKPVKLSDLRGSVVLIDFWATWCGPCIRAMPAMEKFHNDFKDKGVRVIGINTWENDDADPVKFKKDKGLTYGLLLKGDPVAEAWGVAGIPAFVVIGKDGVVLYSNSGYGPAVERAIREAIETGLKP